MQIHQSLVGAALCLIYTAIAVYVVQDELRHSHGGWINLRGMGVTIITAPSQATLGILFEKLGVRRINYSNPGLAGYAQIVLHVAVSALAFYLLGFGIEWLVRRFLLGQATA